MLGTTTYLTGLWPLSKLLNSLPIVSLGVDFGTKSVQEWFTALVLPKAVYEHLNTSIIHPLLVRLRLQM